MEVLAKVWENGLEPVFMSLNIYDDAAKRFAVVSGFTAICLRVAKPNSLFDENGNARPPNLFAATRTERSVPLDWIGVSLLFGGLSVLLV
jgi:hypothetical protein